MVDMCSWPRLLVPLNTNAIEELSMCRASVVSLVLVVPEVIIKTFSLTVYRLCIDVAAK